jgi:YidC/Oxa1 family membrane protein insertase
MDDLEQGGGSPPMGRLVIWVIACLVVFVAWGFITAPARAPVDAAAPKPTAPPAAAAEPIAPPTPSIVEASPAASLPQQEAAPRRVTAQTPRWSVELSNVGGRLTSWKLLDQEDYADPKRPLELVRRRTPPVAEDAKTVDAAELPADDAQDVLPLQVVSSDAALDARLAKAVHVVSSESLPGRQVLTARWSDGAGTSIEKIVTLREDVPLATIEARLTIAGKPAPFRLAWGPGIANHRKEEHSNFYFRRGSIAWLDAAGKVRLVDRPDRQEPLPDQPARWAAVQDSYFTVLFVPSAQAGSTASGTAQGFHVAGTLPMDPSGKVNKKDWPEELVLEVPFSPEAPVQSLYAGPRDRAKLAALDSQFAAPAGLPMLTHLGVLDPLARGLHVALLKLHDWTTSWGWSVVLLTLLVRVVIAPLQFLSMRKMRVMQERMKPMQSKVKALEERYRKLPPTRENRTKQMQEKQEIMLEAGINPAEQLSGCLPQLITMPLFFALLRLLPNAPEFRHEGFLFWKDLSAADPTHLLPLSAAVLTLLSTKLSMSGQSQSIDPMQRNMLYVFPLMLVWLCWSAPLAFVTYQVAMSAVQIGQQQLFNLALAPKPASSEAERNGKPRGEPIEKSAGAASGATAEAPRKKGRKR